MTLNLIKQISFLLNISQKQQVSLSVRLSRNIWCSYYSLHSPSSVWSDSSSNKSKRFEFESSSDYSQGPASRKVANVKTPQNRLKPSVGGLELDYVFFVPLILTRIEIFDIQFQDRAERLWERFLDRSFRDRGSWMQFNKDQSSELSIILYTLYYQYYAVSVCTSSLGN